VDGTAIVPATRTLKNMTDVHLRVNLLGAGDRTRVVLSATYDIRWLEENGRNNVAEGHRHGWTGEVWEQVETAAAAVRPAVTEPTAGANQ
jgi:hypothetical protein